MQNRSFFFCSILLIALGGFFKSTAQYIIVTPNTTNAKTAANQFEKVAAFNDKVFIIVPAEKQYQTEKFKQLVAQKGFKLIESTNLYLQYHNQNRQDYTISLFNQTANKVFEIVAANWNDSVAAIAKAELAKSSFYGASFDSEAISAQPGLVAYHSAIKEYVQFYIGKKSKTWHYNDKNIRAFIIDKLLQIDTAQYDMKELRAEKSSLFTLGIPSINIDSTINLIVQYDANYFVKDAAYKPALLVLQFDQDENLKKYFEVAYQGNAKTYIQKAAMSGDSVILITTKEIENKTLALAKYHKSDKEFAFAQYLPIDRERVFQNAALKDNYFYNDLFQYPFLATQYENKVYNAITGAQAELIPDADFNTILNTTKNSGKKFVDFQSFAVTASYFNPIQQKLFVIYNHNNATYLVVMNDKMEKLKSVKLTDVLPKKDKNQVYYSFDLRNTPLLVQTYKKDTDLLHSATLDLNILLQ